MKRILVAGMTSLALALPLRAQPDPSAGRPVPEMVGKVVSLRQGSRPAEKFITLRAWERPDKTILRYLRSEETGELATLVETPGQTQAQLYRWGPGRTQPPPGVPTIPEPATSEPARLPEVPLSQSASPAHGTAWKPTVQETTPTAPLPPAGQVTPAPTPNSTAAAPNTDDGTSPRRDARPSSMSPSVSTYKPVPATASQVAAPSVSTVPPTATQDQGALVRQLSELDRAGATITLHFPDKGVQTCVILSKTTAADGTVALTVRSQATGEVMTVTTAPVQAPVATLVSSLPHTSPATGAGNSHPTPTIYSESNVSLANPAVGQTPVPPRESFWSRLRRRLGLSDTAPAPAAATVATEYLAPPPAPAPRPREVHNNLPDSPSSAPAGETRIIVGPVPTPSPNVPSASSQNLHSPPSTPAAAATASPLPTPSTVGAPDRVAPPGQQPVPTPPERRGLLQRWFRHETGTTSVNAPRSSEVAPPSPTAEQVTATHSQVLQMIHLAALLPPQRVTSPTIEPPVPFPPRLANEPNTPPTAPHPDPLREPDKYVRHNPVRREVTNAGLLANPLLDKPALPPGSDKPSPGGSTSPTPGRPSSPSSAPVAPVPMPLVPLVTDKPRPEAPPPQPPIQPFSTLPVAATQNPHMFPQIVPPVVPAQPGAPATPVSWTRGPLVPPQQSPVSALALQAGGNATEALALRNTLFLTNVLQASGSPQQREWAAARLAVIDPNRYPFAVEALVQAVQRDPHPAVRIKAMQSLALMRADSQAVRQTIHTALRDPDPRIREQAGYALQLLSASNQADVIPASQPPTIR
ncbi:MAG: HEAT repeat domain-containing protein [Gemmatales bacterium]|nr:HEAT repeat domain-containing protein [Gemmatales bacterium]MDW8176560.1 HEAT repeat domain-containing protein [Gemmatales bacterium]